MEESTSLHKKEKLVIKYIPTLSACSVIRIGEVKPPF